MTTGRVGEKTEVLDLHVNAIETGLGDAPGQESVWKPVRKTDGA
jgi:hypothetical protein